MCVVGGGHEPPAIPLTNFNLYPVHQLKYESLLEASSQTHLEKIWASSAPSLHIPPHPTPQSPTPGHRTYRHRKVSAHTVGCPLPHTMLKTSKLSVSCVPKLALSFSLHDIFLQFNVFTSSTYYCVIRK